MVLGSDPGRAASVLWQFRLFHFISVLRRRHYKPSVPSTWCPCQRSERSHTGGKCVTCRGFRNSEINAPPVLALECMFYLPITYKNYRLVCLVLKPGSREMLLYPSLLDGHVNVVPLLVYRRNMKARSCF